MHGNGYFPDEEYRHNRPARIPAALWQLFGLFILFLGLLWYCCQ